MGDRRPMRKLLGLCSLAIVSLPLTAAAQPPPPPPPPPGGGFSSGVEEEPKMRLDVGLFVAMEQSDDLMNIDPSPGVSLAFGFTVAPNASIFAGIRYIAVQPENDDTGVDVSYYDFIAGGRYAFPVSPSAKVFGEAFLGYGSVEFSDDSSSLSGSGLQFGAKGGGMFKVGGKTSIGG